LGNLHTSSEEYRTADARFLLNVDGSGKNAHIIQASLCKRNQDDTLSCIAGVKLKTIHIQHAQERAAALAAAEAALPDFVVNHQSEIDKHSEIVYFTLTFDVTDAQFTDTSLTLCVSNGFHACASEISIQLNNVVVFGKMSHGKSTLVRALKAYAKKEPYPKEVPRANIGINPENHG